MIFNQRNGVQLANQTRYAVSFWERFRGLMMRESSDFRIGQALVIDPCTSVHMFFMKFSIDVLYLSREGVIVRTQSAIKPWRVGPLHTKGARLVVELPEGVIERTGTVVGDRVSVNAG